MKKILFASLLLLPQTQAEVIKPNLSSQEFFLKLSTSNMNLVPEFYDTHAVLQDPLGKHEGIEAIRGYYSQLYARAESVRFELGKHFQSDNEEVLFWTLYLKSRSLNGGDEYSVEGNSHIVYSPETKKCTFHRDYFDMGAFIYEKIPILKQIILILKSRLNS